MPGTVVGSLADVGTLVRELDWVVSSMCTRSLPVITATCVVIRGATISGLVGKNSFPATVCTAVGPAVGFAVLNKGLGVGTGGCKVLRVVAVRAGAAWATLVLVAGRICAVEDCVKVGGEGIPVAELTLSVSVASVGRGCKLGGFDSVNVFSWCGLLWCVGSAVRLLESISTGDAIVDIRTAATGVSLALGWASVGDEGSRVVWDTGGEAGVDSVRDIGKGGGEDEKGVGASEVDSGG